MRCPNCGAENADTSKFCKMCGIPLPSLQNGNTNNGSWQRDPYRKNNTLLLTALIAILTVILVTCLFLVVKYTFLDRIWKDPQSSTVIAQSENNAPLDPPAAAEEPAQPAEAAPAPITPYTTPAKGESIIHDHDAGQQDGGGKKRKGDAALHSLMGTETRSRTAFSTASAVTPFIRASGVRTRRWQPTGRAMRWMSSGIT